MPLWAPDGQHIVFRSNRTGVMNIYSTSAAGNDPAELVFDAPALWPSSWSPDGEWLVVTVGDAGRGADLALFDPSTGELQPLLSSPFNENYGAISPDGRWIAYRSDDSGRDEIYVARFPSMDDRVQLSVDGASSGIFPAKWSADGRTLYILSGSKIVSVDVRAGSTFEAELPETIFDIPNLQGFDVSPDGETFVLITDDTSPVTHVNVILNWLEELDED